MGSRTATATEIEEDIYQLLATSGEITAMINGEVYHEGERPLDSKKEDAVVIFTAGVPDEIQRAVVTINIYVPDVLQKKNRIRCRNIEIALAEWVDALRKHNYRFELVDTIHTSPAREIHQHYVVCRLKIKFY